MKTPNVMNREIFCIILKIIWQKNPHVFNSIWKCACDCFSKCFSFENTSKKNFIFLKLFLISTNQNDFKILKNINLKKIKK